jgi:TusA-related sulfurtransferase
MDADLTVNASGTWCPVPIIEISKAMRRLAAGGVVLLLATDPAVERDLRHWCTSTGNELLSFESKSGVFRAYVRKPTSSP